MPPSANCWRKHSAEFQGSSLKIEDLETIQSIGVDTNDVGYKFLAKDKAKWRLQTRETADHSLPYTVARAFLDGTITRSTYDVAKFSDPQVLAMIDKITVHEDPLLAAQMPSLANRVTIVLKSGATFSEELGTKEILVSALMMPQ